jgi:UPF0271 protein
MLTIDLNCDMGEGAGNDAAIMPYISSANIACGYHAGDEATMQRTVQLALEQNVAIGAHPGFADKENFGRLEMVLPLSQVYDLVAEQVYILRKIASSLGTILHHVKPHGALYNMAANDIHLAEVIAKAVKDVEPNLIFYGLYNSFLTSVPLDAGLKIASEVFADRRYHKDGKLVSRQTKGAVIEDENKAVEQALNMVLQNSVASVEGEIIAVYPQTLCLHGDGKNAVAFAKKIHEALIENNIKIQTT